jgi:ABC-2 type transport system ATP-binding protein
MGDFLQRNSRAATLVRSPQWERLQAVLESKGARTQPDPGGSWRVSGPDAAAIGDIAAQHRIHLHELSPRVASLEEVYLQMTRSSVEYRAGRPAPDQHQAAIVGNEG